MSKKIALYYPYMNARHIDKIRNSAPDCEFVVLEDNNSACNAEQFEVVFGYVKSEFLKAAKNLVWYHTYTAGVDSHLKPETSLPESVVLTNSAGVYGIAISEHLICATLMLMRNMAGYVSNQLESKWEALGKVNSIYGSNITIVGLGDIGSNFAQRCSAMGASNINGVVRRFGKEKPGFVNNLYTVDKLNEALQDADVVALCMPGTTETKDMFSKERIDKMKPGAILLNVGRGSAINQDDLANALRSGQLGGAAIDVTTPEPLPADSPLWKLPNLIITPHISGDDSLDLTIDLIVDRFIKFLGDYLAGRPFDKVVDKAAGY